MREISEKVIDDFEGVAVMGSQALREFFTYQGTDSKFFQKARLGAAAISAYARIRASETNRMAIEMTSEKLGIAAQRDATAPKQLARAK